MIFDLDSILVRMLAGFPQSFQKYFWVLVSRPGKRRQSGLVSVSLTKLDANEDCAPLVCRFLFKPGKICT